MRPYLMRLLEIIVDLLNPPRSPRLAVLDVALELHSSRLAEIDRRASPPCQSAWTLPADTSLSAVEPVSLRALRELRVCCLRRSPRRLAEIDRRAPPCQSASE